MFQIWLLEISVLQILSCVMQSTFKNEKTSFKVSDFEFISISMAVVEIKSKQSSGTNYILTEKDKHTLTGIGDSKWNGTLPYELLVEPGGKIVYSKQGVIDEEELRKIIFSDDFIGRLYKEFLMMQQDHKFQIGLHKIDQ